MPTNHNSIKQQMQKKLTLSGWRVSQLFAKVTYNTASITATVVDNDVDRLITLKMLVTKTNETIFRKVSKNLFYKW